MPADASPAVKQALGLVSHGDIPGALALLERVPASEQSANYHLYRASLFLDVGRVDEARADIDKALAKDPKAGLAYALRAIIEVVQNERRQALASAEKAVALTPFIGSRQNSPVVCTAGGLPSRSGTRDPAFCRQRASG